ncbi:trehalose import ATP-binding protein SugC [Streptomyces acidiscabies]|uniref:ABC transporter ATP-binding protein n=1 Tax=Streptomyces acidiscabies TaxID=42234 RepID=UPI0002890E88|nr:trehalose import ATP-binding protein SugC [Streptomyces acidiscabies]GAV37259.1 trehalose import ATP-binding protein SugC [Streptomyces acidiscabies]
MARAAFDKVTRRFPKTDRPAVHDLELEDVDSGAVLIGDRDMTRLPPKDRDIAMVFQNHALHPHMTAADNTGFALRIAKPRKADVRHRVAEEAGVLMDEPLSNLDAKLRVRTRTQIAALRRPLGTTTVHVTHDQVEALTMGDRVAVLRDGEPQQVVPLRVRSEPFAVLPREDLGTPGRGVVVGAVEDTGAVTCLHTTAESGREAVQVAGRTPGRIAFRQRPVGA